MNTAQHTLHSNQSFKYFLFGYKWNRYALYLSAASVIIQFAIFKYLYPYASFIHGDSFSYIKAAFHNLDINTYMVGYSRFLRLFSVFTKSDTALIAFQYLFIQSSTLFLLFTILYFYTPSKITQYVLLVFMVFNPLFLHLANLVSSDCLFAAFSLTWFALLLWIIHRPSNRIIILHALILFIAFTFRYNALIYPLIASVAFRLSSLPLRKKLAGIGGVLLLCGLFVFYTSYQYKKLTDYWQYSPFSGWQLTNNAMYTYRYVDSARRKPVPEKFRVLDNMIRQYFDSTRDLKKFPIEELQASTVYMWTKKLTLYKYRDQLFQTKDSTADEFKRWASMGPLYKDYGLYIIRQYPWYFARYFLWPNSIQYYAPPVEFLSVYNSDEDGVTKQTQVWFGYKSQKVKTRMKNNAIWILKFYPILSGIINVVMLLNLLCYWLLKGWQLNPLVKKGVVLGSTVWLVNAAFTIGASTVALRFQSFPILIATIFVALLLDWLWKVAMSSQATNSNHGMGLDLTEHTPISRSHPGIAK